MAKPKTKAHRPAPVEQRFKQMALKKGWKAHRCGWPDYLLVADGKPIMVEVKSWDDKLSKGQKELFATLELMGIVVRVWWEGEPEKLMNWRNFLARSGFLLRRESPRPARTAGEPAEPRYTLKQIKRLARLDQRIDRELGR